MIEATALAIKDSEIKSPLLTVDVMTPEFADNAMQRDRILIISADGDILQLLSAFFEVKYNVVTAFDGAEALKLVQEQDEVSLIISDVMINEIDGYALCKVLKSSVGYAHIPIVLFSTPGDPEDNVQGLEFGADAYMKKPLCLAYLGAQIRNLLENRARLKACFTGELGLKLRIEALKGTEEGFQEVLEALINFHISNPLLSVAFLARKMHMSRPSFYHRTKMLCNITPYKMIDRARLTRAAAFISEGRFKLNDIASAVGFNSPAQFSKSFKRQFGVPPSGYNQYSSGNEAG